MCVFVSPYISYVLPFSFSHSEESSEEEEEEEEEDESDESPLSMSESDMEHSGDSDDMEAEEVRGHATGPRVIVLPANFYIQYITMYDPMYDSEVGCSLQPSFIMCRTKLMSPRCTFWVTETAQLSINSGLRLRYFHGWKNAFPPLPSL